METCDPAQSLNHQQTFGQALGIELLDNCSHVRKPSHHNMGDRLATLPGGLANLLLCRLMSKWIVALSHLILEWFQTVKNLPAV